MTESGASSSYLQSGDKFGSSGKKKNNIDVGQLSSMSESNIKIDTKKGIVDSSVKMTSSDDDTDQASAAD